MPEESKTASSNAQGNDGSSNDGPSNDGPSNDGPSNDGQSSNGQSGDDLVAWGSLYRTRERGTPEPMNHKDIAAAKRGEDRKMARDTALYQAEEQSVVVEKI